MIDKPSVHGHFQGDSLLRRPRSREVASPACALIASLLCRTVYRGGIENEWGRDLELSCSTNAAEKARAISFVTGATDLTRFDQKDVAVAVDRDRLDVLYMPRGCALVPVRPARSREKVRLPRRERIPQCRFIHPGHHQNLAVVGVLNNRRHQSFIVPLQCREERRRFVRVAHDIDFQQDHG
jgi:hypothetical protein